MDINSLLSPSDSPAGTPVPQQPPALPSPSKRAMRQMPSRTSSGLSRQIISSPQPHPSPGLAHMPNGARVIHSANSTPQSAGSPHDARMTPPRSLFRQGSTPGMDTLAGRYPLSLRKGSVRCWNLEVSARRLCDGTLGGDIPAMRCAKQLTIW